MLYTDYHINLLKKNKALVLVTVLRSGNMTYHIDPLDQFDQETV